MNTTTRAYSGQVGGLRNRLIAPIHALAQHFWAFRLRPAEPGDLALQSGVFLLAIPVATYLFAVPYLMVGDLGQFAAIVLQVLGFLAAAVFARAHGQRTFWPALGITFGVYLVSLVLCRFFVDLSYDGQDYHYTAIWALANGWNPYGFGEFADFAAPASDVEPWASAYPKADWLYLAIEVAAGFGIETAKNSGVMFAAASLLCMFGALRKLGAATLPSGILALCAAANPVTLSQLFLRMCDGRLASLAVIFLSLALLAIHRKDWRYVPAALLAMTMAINTKFSMIPVFMCLGAGACLGLWARESFKPAAIAGFAFLGCVLVATFFAGWDPYLRNVVTHGHPFYPVMGANTVDLLSGWRPAALEPHGDLTRLWMSLASTTEQDGPHYKIPFTITAAEFEVAGDPEPRFAGFGPWFLPGLVAAIASLLALTLTQRLQRRETSALLLAVAAGVLLSILAMPESWLARYVPQSWLFPVLIAAAAVLSPSASARTVGRLAIGLLLANAAIVGASAFTHQTSASMDIHRQIASLLEEPGALCANFGASPARWALLTDAGLEIEFRNTPPPEMCHDVQQMPYVLFEEGTDFGDICRCPAGTCVCPELE